MTAKIYLYAEVLTNIRQVTLYASLQTERNEETKVDVASDRKTVSVTHNGETSTMFLPTAISGSAKVTIPVEKAKELSARLEIGSPSDVVSGTDAANDEVPWSAGSLTDSTKLYCRSCDHLIFTTPGTLTWQNLPSENWAEMMDFWHCHRPQDNHHAGEAIASSKGYGPSNKVHASKRVGLVDILSFLLAETDCSGAKKSEERLPTGHSKLLCAQCDQLVGFVDEAAQGSRLYKWSLLVRKGDESSLSSVSAESLICSQLLALIDALGIRKFVLHSGESQNSCNNLLLWVFNPDLRYSSSAIAGARRAMKVFYCSAANTQELLDKNTITMEELFLPDPILLDFHHVLQKSTNLLPISARKFQSWDVALLDRWENGESAQEVIDTMGKLGIAKDLNDERRALYE